MIRENFRDNGADISDDQSHVNEPNLAPEPLDMFQHQSVLLAELTEGFALTPGGHYLDATVGGGGHSACWLQQGIPIHLTIIDQDPLAITAALSRLTPLVTEQMGSSSAASLTAWQGNFADYASPAEQFDGIIADLGVSSPQFDQPERGFSFRYTAPLDMRMNPDQELTAAEIVNHWSERDLVQIFSEYGEERFSRRIARRIVTQRPLHTTTELAETIIQSVPGKFRHGRIHPATRVFQALRITVNQELDVLSQFIQQAATWLKPSGRLGIISFHSLEDRIVKHRFRELETLKPLTKKPIRPTTGECRQNSRARSAKLRWAEKIT